MNNDDGFVSIEVDPNFANKSGDTYKEGKRLYSGIGMPNVMIKVPATKPGFEAMKNLMSKGVNINANYSFWKISFWKIFLKKRCAFLKSF